MDPDPNPTPFFGDFKDAKKVILFSSKLPAGTLTLVLKIIFCGKILFFKHYFSPLNTFMRKGKDPELDPNLSLMDPDGPKTMRIRFRIPNTVLNK
jgi:hypothetical protein